MQGLGQWHHRPGWNKKPPSFPRSARGLNVGVTMLLPTPLSVLADGSSGASGVACGDFFSAWRLRMLLFLPCLPSIP